MGIGVGADEGHQLVGEAHAGEGRRHRDAGGIGAGRLRGREQAAATDRGAGAAADGAASPRLRASSSRMTACTSDSPLAAASSSGVRMDGSVNPSDRRAGFVGLSGGASTAVGETEAAPDGSRDDGAASPARGDPLPVARGTA